MFTRKLNVLAIAHALMFHAAATDAAVEPKKKPFCDKDYDEETGAYSFAFADGETIEGNLADFTPEFQKKFALHGIMQKGGDSYAGAKGDLVAGKQALRDVLENAKNGIWRAVRGEGESRPRLGELAEAIARIKAVPVEKAMQAVEAATDDQRKQWRSNAAVKANIAQIRAEVAQKAAEAAGAQNLEVNIQ